MRYFEIKAPCTAASRSASLNTIKGALPPSSIDVFLRVGTHCASSNFPTSVDPVNDSLRTIGLLVSSLPISDELPTTTFNTPSGMPARLASSASASADKGVSLAGLMTIEHPAASAGAAFRVIIALGKFQGVIAAQTPTGCLIHTIRLSGDGPGMTSPSMRFACSANHSM